MGNFAAPRLVTRGIMGKLEDHVRPSGHFRHLARGEVERRRYKPRVASHRIFNMKAGRRLFVTQLHVPGKTMAFFGPVHISRIQKVSERYEQLDGDPDNGRTNDQTWPPA